jgi:hypothetical protein
VLPDPCLPSCEARWYQGPNYLRRPSVNGGTPSMVAHDTLDWQFDVGRTRTGSRWNLSKVDCSVGYTGRASATEINSRKCTDAARSIFGPSMRSVTVDVIGYGISLREHVLRSLSGVHRVTHHDMRKPVAGGAGSVREGVATGSGKNTSAQVRCACSPASISNPCSRTFLFQACTSRQQNIVLATTVLEGFGVVQPRTTRIASFTERADFFEQISHL